MNDVKTRPKTRDIKVRDQSALAPKELSRLMRESAEAKRRNDREPGEQSASGSAVREPQNEYETGAANVAVDSTRKAAVAGRQLAQKQYNEQFRTKSLQSAKQADRSAENGQPVTFSGMDSPPAARAREEYRRTKAREQLERRREIRTLSERTESRRNLDDLQKRNGAVAETAARSSRSATETGAVSSPKEETKYAESASAQAKSHATRDMQRQMMQETAKKTAQTAKRTARGLSRFKDAAVRAGKAVARAAVGLLGGAGGLIALVLLIGGAAAVVGTPFGVFWSGADADAGSMPQAVTQINAAFTAKIRQIEAENPADSVVVHRIPDGGSDLSITNWPDVVTVFAVKTAGADANAADVVTIDAERTALLEKVFWDMNAVSYSVETVNGSTILHITITSRAAEEMPDIYGFNRSQRQALTEMLKPEYAQMLAELVGTYGGEMSLTDEQVKAMLAKMPENLPADRRAVVQTAYSLLGRVSYFWGGKSSAIGWDSRWGKAARVTAPGSRTTGTVRPYGLDCSGFVDWTFNNALGCVVGRGGGAASQHGYCTPISWSQALPGDLVFYPGDTHVGIFVGTDEDGNPLIIHCASSQNSVVLTGLQGFTAIGRPGCYGR